MGLNSFKEEGQSTLGIVTIRVSTKLGLMEPKAKAFATNSQISEDIISQ